MKHLLCAFILLLTVQVSAQFDTINQVNSKGKKDGYWKVYLDSMAYPTDSANAYFYGYNFYDNGEAVFTYDRSQGWRRNYRLVYCDEMPDKGKPVPINGTFKFFTGDSVLVNLEIYKDGKPLFWEAYSYAKSDTLHAGFIESFYFDKLYNNTPGTYYFTYTSYHGDIDHNTTEFWFRKGKKGWKSYKIK